MLQQYIFIYIYIYLYFSFPLKVKLVMMGSTNSLAQMTPSNTSVYLATAWTKKSKPLMRSFNA